MASIAGRASDNGPVPTIYVRNLEERIKIEELIDSLHEIFSEYGNIIDIVAKKSLKRKGQAFIVFDNVESAARAIEEIQEFELFGKPMQLDFARTRSDKTVEQEGTADELEQHKRARLAEKERKQALDAQEAQKQLKRQAATAPEPAAARPAKTGRGAGLKPTGGAAAVVPDEYLPPNKILFIQNIPAGYDVDSLTAIFSRFDGFKEVRSVPGRSEIAFVEYQDENGAIEAKKMTAGMTLGDEGKPMKITFQRQ